MNLVASMIVDPDAEISRYLPACVEALTAFCDDVRVFAQGGSPESLAALRRLPVSVQEAPGGNTFFNHEGAARQAALEWTLEANPTHVLAVDADEIVTDGENLRKHARDESVTRLCMQEVWKAHGPGLAVRMDGGWRPHPAPILWAVPSSMRSPDWRIPAKKLASGRVPPAVIRASGRGRYDCPSEILHLGWACEADRAARYARYEEHDKGAFHSSGHLRSIMWPDSKVRLCWQEWPATVSESVVEQVVARAGRGSVPEGEPGF